METKQLILGATLCSAALMPYAAWAAEIGLYEWAFNVDGGLFGNQFQDPDALTDVPGLNSSDFDENTGLGTLVYTTSTIGAHYFIGYFDLEINVPDNGFNNENASVSQAGSPGSGQSWETDEPFNSDIFDHFANNQLTNANGVDLGTYPIGTDVAMATGFDFLLREGQVATVTMQIAESLQTNDFKLIQTDFGTGDEAQLTASLSIRNVGEAPLPGTLSLLALGLLGLHRFSATRNGETG